MESNLFDLNLFVLSQKLKIAEGMIKLKTVKAPPLINMVSKY